MVYIGRPVIILMVEHFVSESYNFKLNLCYCLFRILLHKIYHYAKFLVKAHKCSLELLLFMIIFVFIKKKRR